MAIPDHIALHFGAEQRTVSVGKLAYLGAETPLTLDCGQEIADFPLAYQTYGQLNADASNAILICHGLTGDQYVASPHPVTGKPGWWENMVGEGKPIDTSRYFVICSNVLGGCMGSYGPRSEQDDGTPIGLDFPIVTLSDMVRAQALLMDHLGIDRLAAVIGGSMGGMQTLSWLSLFPQRVERAIIIATSATMSPQNIAFNEIGRQAIMVDPQWHQGKYTQYGEFPARGLAVARMAAHVTYLSEHGLQQKFGRDLQEKEKVSYGFDADFQIESYLRYQGKSFVSRFDPNSYCYLTRAMDYFDLTAEKGKIGLANSLKGCLHKPILLLSFSSDWLFSTAQMRELARAFSAADAAVSFSEIESDKGHDGFLLPNTLYEEAVKGFLS